jgi:glycerol kinase
MARKRKEVVGALDLGTSGVRFFLFDLHARPIASAYCELPLSFPRPGWVEQDSGAMVEGALSVIREALEKAGLSPADLLGFGLTNQRETLVLWERDTGKPFGSAIVWQDRRTAERCQALRASPLAEEIRAKTGLLPDPYFSATKLEWLFSQDQELRRRAEKGEILAGTVDSWLLFALCGVHATDPTNASLTLLFHIQKLVWDQSLCELFGVPKGVLSEVRPSLPLFGRTKRELLGAEIPVAGVLGDQQAARFGQGCLDEGEGKVTWGTGAFLLVNTGASPAPPPEGILATVAYSRNSEVFYALEGSAFIAGAAIQWLRDSLGIIKNASETEELAQSLPENEGVYFVPALVGLGAPHWDPYARGTIVGLTRGTTRAHLARAALEAIAYQTHDLLRAMERALGKKLSELRVDGCAAKKIFFANFRRIFWGFL